MGKASKALKGFIDNIPDSDLEALPTSAGTIYSDDNFRLDMQGMTSSQEYNLQVQINKGTTISTLKKFSPATVAGPVLVPSDDPWSASKIRNELIDNILI
ncbi:hypothetical protein BU26DRAFT_12098 [Trematosphaeria pertusa]|uniref:Uncharacterized protein n=1 Tax=Trematosphaeria pertusa TaxID=390896 RepID=A0A6A6J391_9PLEO|nr:uncharacterized protein BU26DRAFT_12098 [Trematosphaeria pertusa]KAF2255933.1 hypothetical protein BU26DRAFT_12098 [Trematosphaeria pertusa]